MKKLIFLLTMAFFSCSLVVNAQNSSKLSYNTDGSLILSEELKTKLKTKGISEVDYLQQMAVRKQVEQPIQKQAKVTQPKFEIKTIDKTQLKVKRSVNQTKTVEKKAIPRQVQNENLAAQAIQMNKDFAKKGLQYKTQIKTFAGKQYIEIVDLPKQNGIAPTKSKQ